MPVNKTVKVRTCDKIWMSQKEAQKYLGVSKDWLKERRLDGRLHYSMVGTTAFYIKSEIDALIRRNAVTGIRNFREAASTTPL
ncbi:MAG: helix-turn-helix domain-containing protein [Prevotella sp.]|nr:helix-turn-helix domain-containing protein [Prevotella sp.]